MDIKFGSAGMNIAFSANKNNNLMMFPNYLANLKLSAFEYQCGHGIRVKEDFAKKFGNECKKHDIFLSVHAPYYISLSSIDENKRKNSVDYILQTAKLAKAMGAKRIVVHSGSCAKISRVEALELSSETLKKAVLELENHGLSEITVCPELMGKTNQLGDLDEVIELSKISENVVPCIDFGHLNARLFGGLQSLSDFENIFLKIENELGNQKLKSIHIHFSKIEYSKPGGEVRHLNFDDEVYGPNFEMLADILVKKSIFPVVICESAGTQVEDAVTMKRMYESLI